MWSYIRSPTIELGIPDPALPAQLKPHVHRDVQIMFVTQGTRRVALGGHVVSVPPRSALIIPSGVAHVGDGENWRGFNAYVAGEHLSARFARIIHLGETIEGALWFDEDDRSRQLARLNALLHRGQTLWSDPALRPFSPDVMSTEDWPRSREGGIRRYRRKAGITPHAHFRALRLDAARRMLATGAPVAGVAADLDFTDQSHLGRQFLSAFGVTPARYAAGWQARCHKDTRRRVAGTLK